MKARRAPTIFRNKNATKPGHLLHLDLHFLETETEEGDRYYTIVVDAYSRMFFIFFHKDEKDTTVVAISDHLLIKLRQTPPKVITPQEIFSDNAKKYVRKEVAAWCTKHHITHTLSSPYYSYQNGLAESPGFYLMDTRRALMKEAEMPDQYIHYGLRHAVDLHNSMYSSSLPADDSIPYTRHFKEPVTFKHLLPFGSYVACFIPKAPREPGDYQNIAQEGVYLGRSSTQGYASRIVALFPNGKTVVTPEYQADPTLFPLRTQAAQRFRPFAHPLPITDFGKDSEMDSEPPIKFQVGDSTYEPKDIDSEDDGPP